MSERSGLITVLQTAATHAAVDTYYDVTNTINSGVRCNSMRLYVTAAVASPGDISFRLTINNPGNPDLGATTYYDYATEGEGHETFGPLKFTAVGTKVITLTGLDLVPSDVIQVSYAASAAAASATVAIVGETFHSDLGGSQFDADISADMGDIDTNTAKSASVVFAEDTAHTTADPGNQILVVRNDTLASLCGTDGDYTPLQVNADGGLYVEVATLPGSTIADNAFTGATTIASTTAITTAFELDSITLHLSAAGTTNEDFTIGLDANAGTAYDTNLFTLDLSTDSIIDLVLTPEQDGIPRFYKAGDELVFVWPNTETRTYGIRIVTKGV